MKLLTKSIVALFLLLFCRQVTGENAAPIKIRVNGVELHYIEQGHGEPVVLLHGGQADYRAWGAQMPAFAEKYRVIAYSRRYNYPNKNPVTPDYRVAYSDAEDLAGLIGQLKLGRVHLVGVSIGAFTALVLAIEHPDMVRSLILAEAPIHRWAANDPKGAPLQKEFEKTIWEPATAAFNAGSDEGAMRIFVNGFAQTNKFDKLPPEARAVAMQNAGFFRAVASSSDPFPDLSKDKVKRLQAPVLLVTGENTLPVLKFISDELAGLLPKVERTTIPNAGHASARENPQAFNQAVLTFLARHTGRSVQNNPPSPQATARQASDE
jgi:non-heme chloroperoxidase